MNAELGFSSKIDLWLLVVLLTAVAVCIWVIGDQWSVITSSHWLLGVSLVFGAGLPLWVVASTRYFLSDHTLRIRCGPLRIRVPIAGITAIKPTRNALSSPALSLDRLRIEYGAGRAVMISPEPRDEFLRQLEFRRRQLAG
jgi:membrane protein YdbS with pleckstrin-like domain